jgi:hypothetical protein
MAFKLLRFRVNAEETNPNQWNIRAGKGINSAADEYFIERSLARRIRERRVNGIDWGRG